jgi:hypothetical protein
MEQKIHGGKRKGAGRKPVADKKKQITLYVETKKIFPFGTEEKMKADLYNFIESKSMVQDLTKITNEVKAFEQPKTNYDVKIEPKPETIPLGNFEIFRMEILKTTTIPEIEAIMKRVKSSLMFPKEKLSLEQIAKEHSKQFYND